MLSTTNPIGPGEAVGRPASNCPSVVPASRPAAVPICMPNKAGAKGCMIAPNPIGAESANCSASPSTR